MSLGQQRGNSNPAATLAALVSKRSRFQDELRNIENQVYELETSYLQDIGQFGNAFKGFEGFLSSGKNTSKLKNLELGVMMEDSIMALVGLRVETCLLTDRVNQRGEEWHRHQEMGRETGQVNQILMMRMTQI
ncbi:hypothetical protein AB3S75_044607 [Citrus x aurantiifolia]